ncbi:transcriptional regulator [Catenovulum agarivorans DS-2]|uniref:Transcriptional regulator n=1 Tax=Catenovulum agarivorans DS-2 TaxID=1328313 RepID=W7QJS8_9ALTE|nr:helix-turn-helix domain-containing protein [Catenovulum agarivorans]EWH09232.1 transcriptional regulator [Catenovulum agarivorans DS-2]
MKSKGGAQANQSILDGIRVLQAIAGSEKPIGGKDLCELLGLESTRANRLLKTLASMGMTEQTKGRKYIAGPGIHVLSAQSLYGSGLLCSAIPTLEKLGRFNLTVAMGVLWYDTVSFIYHANPGMSSAEAIGRVGVMPATCSGIGLALLARTPIESLIDVYKDKEIPNFQNGLDQLISELEKIRQQGYVRFQGIQNGIEPTGNRCSIAVEVGSPANSAIAMQGEIDDVLVQELVPILIQAKEGIEQQLHIIKPHE